MSASVAPTVGEVREATRGAIDDAIRELQVAIKYLELRRQELDRQSLPFVRVFPPRTSP